MISACFLRFPREELENRPEKKEGEKRQEKKKKDNNICWPQAVHVAQEFDPVTKPPTHKRIPGRYCPAENSLFAPTQLV